MVKTKLKDFIEVDYTGRIKDNNQIFDLTSEELAKKEEDAIGDVTQAQFFTRQREEKQEEES